jgi:type IV secretion system protein VirB10
MMRPAGGTDADPPPGSRGAPPPARGVRGERSSAAIARVLSIQARVSHYLALGLMLAIGAGLLAWYYAHQFARHGHARTPAAGVQPAAAEMALPPLGPLGPPRPVVAPPPTAQARMPPLSASTPASASAPQPAPLGLLLTRGRSGAPGTGGAGALTPRQTTRGRRLAGGVLFMAPAASAAGAPGVAPSAPPPAPVPEPGGTRGDTSGRLAGLLQASPTRTVAARLLPDRSLLLPMGAFIDCTLETAIDSTLPGMTTCVTATDTFSADGRVVLLERGTKLIGETRGAVQQGMARVFVLWTEARAPDGVVVPLDSPGADQLGRSGLPGHVQRHFWQRFGAAIMVSAIDGGVQAGVQSAGRGNGAIIYDPGAAQDVMTQVLKSTVAIAPTVIKRNGDRIQVLVAQDVDFSRVYELRDAGRER